MKTWSARAWSAALDVLHWSLTAVFVVVGLCVLAMLFALAYVWDITHQTQRRR